MNNSFTFLRNVIAAVRRGELGEYEPSGAYKAEPVCFNVYWRDEEGTPELDDEVFVGPPAVVDDNVPDEEYDQALLPEEVKERGWCLSYSGELIENVISNALMQKPAAGDQELLEAIRYYSDHDAFLEFE